MRKKKTEEEKKETKRIRMKAYRLENKEKIAAKAKEYNRIKMQDPEYREKMRLKASEYRKNNPEKVSSYWKENRSEIQRRYRESLKDGLYTVYYLPEEHYVGQTHSIKKRIEDHRYARKRHVLDVEVLAKFETRKEALAFEAKLHDMGYHGKNNGI